MKCREKMKEGTPVIVVTMGDECPVVEVSWGCFVKKLNDEEVIVIPLERAQILHNALSSYPYAQAVVLKPDEKGYCWFRLKAFVIKEHDEKNLFAEIKKSYPREFEALLIGKILEAKEV